MTGIALTFVAAYLLIAFESPLRLNKSAIALVAAGIMWVLWAAVAPGGTGQVIGQLTEKLGEAAAIVFFLIAAMTLVELVDAHDGFQVITRHIRPRSLKGLLWLIGPVAFLLSSILDNMTTTIVMVSLMKRLLRDQGQRQLFAGMIVIAANAGGAWTPIGDVTTTMLWIGGQITTLAIMQSLVLPSLACLVVPLVLLGRRLSGPVVAPERPQSAGRGGQGGYPRLMFALGMGALISVPLFKSLTHLPPWLGILLALGVVWLVSDLLQRGRRGEVFEHLTAARALKRIDLPSAVFFIGILLAVGVLSANGQLPALATWLNQVIPSQSVIVLAIGFASAVVDNIPLVAATQGMYSLGVHPADSALWPFLAYCAGTGGSILVIGSAAGVAAMGLEHIPFFWYARQIGPAALAGYLSGAAVFLLQAALPG